MEMNLSTLDQKVGDLDVTRMEISVRVQKLLEKEQIKTLRELAQAWREGKIPHDTKLGREVRELLARFLG